MATLNEIKAHIQSVQSTKKITRAMYLISASKSQKAKAQLVGAMPFFREITDTMTKMLLGSEDIDTPFVENFVSAGEAKPDLYIVMGGDRGMAGAYNHDILDILEARARKDMDVLWVAGAMSRGQLDRSGYQVQRDFLYAVNDPALPRARDVADRAVQVFLAGKCANVYILYTKMETSLKLVPTIERLLPLDAGSFRAERGGPSGTKRFEYFPTAKRVFEDLAPLYLRGVIYGAFVESFASEQSARMVAMDGATRSAEETIDRLSIQYNRARQSRITQELTEIVAGMPEG